MFKKTWLIGSADDCDPVALQPTVSARHRRLVPEREGYTIEDLDSTHRTYVNGSPIEWACRVTPKDRVRLGPSVPLPWPAVPTGESRRIRVGRAPGNHVVLHPYYVSAYHAVVRVEGGTITVEDLNSTNGTSLTLHGPRIKKATPSPDDILHFGSTPVSVAYLLYHEDAR